MPIPVSRLANDLNAARTVLLFGAGSSMPSGAPSVPRITKHLAEVGGLSSSNYTLAELSGIVEQKTSRRNLITQLRAMFKDIKPTGGLLNLPLYDWKSIYTTNYDDLIEQAYRSKGKELIAYSSNFDFGVHGTPNATKLFKLHGTIEKDVVDGTQSRIIITDQDYDQTEDYREALFARFKSDLWDARLVIVGHSLADPDIKEIVNATARLHSKAHNAGQIALLMYTPDEDRAKLFESRGIQVCFSGIDEFLAALASKLPATAMSTVGAAPLDTVPTLRPVTVDVAHAWNATRADVSGMYNGWSATYADIASGATFERTVAEEISTDLAEGNRISAVLLGASGVGKTTAARQAVGRLRDANFAAFEHVSDHTLSIRHWLELANHLKAIDRLGVLLIDDAHEHLHEVNELVDKLAAAQNANLKLIITSSRHHWSPRVKTPNLMRFGKVHNLSRLSQTEIERLLQLIETNAPIRELVEPVFTGFSRQERRRRLSDRCGADMFVCLRNIFASEKFDDIILRDYATMTEAAQDIYRHVAAMEAAGVRVHRQLVIRLLGIAADAIARVLSDLTDIIHENTVSEREGIYAWRVRHAVIAGIIAKFKFSGTDNFVTLLERVIDSISPTYDIEIRTIRELCNLEGGIPRIPSKETQNRLLRKMMSVAPGERVPRHRLIRNLIALHEFEKAETEIRIFDKDFGTDGPAHRYRVNLMVARAKYTPGIMNEDRIAILENARELALKGIERFPLNKTMLTAYAELGLEYYRKTAKLSFYDDAMAKLKRAEEEFGDPDVSKLVARYENRLSRTATPPEEVPTLVDDDDDE